MLEVGVTTQILTGPKVPDAPRAHFGETVILAPGSPAYEALAAAPLPPVLTVAEARAHFSFWSVSSSPLTLSVDFRDTATLDSVWDIIANPEAIAVNQAWTGHRGGLLRAGNATVTLEHCTWIWAGDKNCTLPVEQQVRSWLGEKMVCMGEQGPRAILSRTCIHLNQTPPTLFTRRCTSRCPAAPLRWSLRTTARRR